MTIGRIEQLTTHVINELAQIKTGVETWQRQAIVEHDRQNRKNEAEIERLKATLRQIVVTCGGIAQPGVSTDFLVTTSEEVDRMRTEKNTEIGWLKALLKERDTTIERLGDDNFRLNKMFRWIWGRVTNNEPGPPPVDVAVERMAECLDAKDARIKELEAALSGEMTDSANEVGESDTRIAALEAQLKDLAENEDPIGCIVRLQAELAERDAEIVRMNKIWDDAVDYGARVRGALVKTREALRWCESQSYVFQDGTYVCCYCREPRGVPTKHLESCRMAILATYKPLAGEPE